MSKPAPTLYVTLKWPVYHASLCERGPPAVWLDLSSKPWHAASSSKQGGQA
ncbi:hypothetical protein [uncultured Jannaschia sp.]|uniref:hypothetical protein n=1 Tax=uncultured Jannaschia sp. TaxID=293347 RepID=UPI0026332635|nr:hypothetical protein [uncultured Jannaschia sp.]